MSIQYALLGLLADRPLHGYELRSAYEADLVPSTRLNFGQVYTTLDRLGQKGWVTHEVVAQPERPDKKVYGLTRAGRHALKDWLEEPTALALDVRNEIFLKIVVARRLEGVDAGAVIARERRACFERLHDASGAKSQAEQDSGSPQLLLLFELAILRLEAFLKWLDRCEEMLGKEKKS